MSRTRTTFQGGRGFTMIELLVVIAVILVLLTLTVTVGSGFVERSEIRETENVLRVLDVAVQEWETVADREVSWGVDGDPGPRARYDMTHNAPDILTLTQLFKTARKPSVVRERINQLEEKFLFEIDASGAVPIWMMRPDDPVTLSSPHDNEEAQEWFAVASNDDRRYIDNEIAVLDAWGTPIRAIHPGFLWADGLTDSTGAVYMRDEDGTVRTVYERRYGVCTGRKIGFVSAGPDGKFGDLHLEATAVASLTPAEKLEAKPAEDNVYSYELIVEREKLQ